MRLFLLNAIIAATPSLGLAAGLSVPYYTDMGSFENKTVDPAWKVINVTEGSNTWKYDGTNDNTTALTEAVCGVMYQYDNKNDAADWLISPSVTLKAGTEYKVSYWMKTANDKEDMDVYLAASDDPEVLKSGTVLMSYSDYIDKTWKKQIKVFTVSEDGDYNVGFFIHSPKGRYNVYLRGFTLSENVAIPARPTGFTAVAAEDKEMKVTLSWTLPTLDTDGNPLAGSLGGVVVSRDGEEIATLSGDATEFVDDASRGLESGFHTYGIYVTMGNQKSGMASASTSYVGPLVPFTLPYSYDFEDEAMWSLWTVIDVDGDALPGQNPPGKTWSRWRNTALTGYLAVFSNPTSAAQEDDWLISPPLMFDKVGRYNLSFAACVYNGPSDGACLMDVCLGTSPTADAMIVPLGNYERFKTTTYPATDGENVNIEINIEEPGTYYVGMHAKGNAVRRQVRVDNFMVEPDVSLLIGETLVDEDYRIEADRICFSHEADTEIYAVSGVKIRSCGYSLEADLSGLSAGMYVVRHGDIVVKIVSK